MHNTPLYAARHQFEFKALGLFIDELRLIFTDVCADFKAELVNSLKGVFSRLIRQKNYPSIYEKLWEGALCSPSYFAGSCSGAPIAVVRQYIEQKRTPHELPRGLQGSHCLHLCPKGQNFMHF